MIGNESPPHQLSPGPFRRIPQRRNHPRPRNRHINFFPLPVRLLPPLPVLRERVGVRVLLQIANRQLQIANPLRPSLLSHTKSESDACPCARRSPASDRPSLPPLRQNRPSIAIPDPSPSDGPSPDCARRSSGNSRSSC